MTESLTQNINIDKDNALNSLLNMNLAQKSETQERDFSNLINNLNAKKETTQTSFVSKIAKTNTSSVNKKALNANKQNDITQKNIVSKDTKKQSLKETIKNEINKKPNETKVEKNNSTDVQTISNQENLNKISNEDVPLTNTDEIKNDVEKDITPQENLSDINNSSFVDPSPVFSSQIQPDEEIQTETQTQEINVNEAIINIMSLLNASDIEGAKEELNDLFSKISNIEEIKQLSQNIISIIEKTDLSQDFKDNLSQNLDIFVSTLENNNETADFSNLFDEIKNTLKEILNSSLESVSLKKDVEISQISDKLETLKEILSNISEKIEQIKTENKDSKKILNTKISNIEDKIDKFLKENSKLSNEEFNSLIEKIDKLIGEINQDFTEISPEIVDLAKQIKDLKPEIKTDLLNKNLENLSRITDLINSSKETKVQKEININVDLINKDFKQALNTIAQEINNIDINKLQNLPQKDKEALKSTLEAFVQNSEQSGEIPPEEIKESLNVLVDNLKQVSKDETTTEQDETTVDLKNDSDKKIDLNKDENSFDENFDKKNNDETKTQVKTNVSYDNQKIENKNNDETKDVEEVKENLTKIASLADMLDEMLINSPSISSINESALSVTDEVIRLSLDDSTNVNSSQTQNSIFTPLQIQHQINKGAQIKAPQGESFNEILTNRINKSNVLGQISDKIVQTKDGSQKLTMVLRPFDLGRLQIELTTNKNGLTTNIIAQNEEVRNYIEKNIENLKQQLSESGVNVNNIQIKTAGQNNTSNYSSDNSQQNQQNLHDEQNNPNSKQNKGKSNNQMLANELGYDFHMAKDFSSILNNTLNYGLN